MKTAASYYVRFLAVGIFFSVCIYISIRILPLAKLFSLTDEKFIQYGPIISAMAIVAVNFLVIIGYSKAIIKNSDLLHDEEAADYAYYLGFSLTIAILALTFFADAVIQIDRKTSGDLVKGSLVQFAAGLTATMIGLATRIYLSALQNVSQSEPSDLLRSLRNQVFEFDKGLKDSSTKQAEIMSRTLESLNRLTNELVSTTEKLTTTFTKISNDLVNSIDNKRIVENTLSLNLALQALTKKIENGANSFTLLNSNATNLNLALEKSSNNFNILESSISEVEKSFSQIDKKDLASLSKEIKSLNTVTTIANKGFTRLNSVVGGELIPSTDRLTASFNSISIQNVNQKFLNLENTIEKVNDELEKFSSLSKSSEDANSVIKDFTVALNLLHGEVANMLEGFTQFDSSAVFDIIKVFKSLNLVALNVSRSFTKFESILDGGLIESASNFSGQINSINTEKLNSSINELNVSFNALISEITEISSSSNTELFQRFKESIQGFMKDIDSIAINSIKINVSEMNNEVVKLYENLSKINQFIEKNLQESSVSLNNQFQKLNDNSLSDSFINLYTQVEALARKFQSVEISKLNSTLENVDLNINKIPFNELQLSISDLNKQFIEFHEQLVVSKDYFKNNTDKV